MTGVGGGVFILVRVMREDFFEKARFVKRFGRSERGFLGEEYFRK